MTIKHIEYFNRVFLLFEKEKGNCSKTIKYSYTQITEKRKTQVPEKLKYFYQPAQNTKHSSSTLTLLRGKTYETSSKLDRPQSNQ